MVKIKLPDGQERTFDGDSVAVSEVLEGLPEGIRRQTVAADFGGQLVDVHMDIAGEGEFKALRESDEGGLYTLRHTTSHVLAWAVQELFPGTKFAIGPPIDNGFYYDFEVETPFTPEDLERIEAKMNELLKSKAQIGREVWDKPKAKKYFEEKKQPYKIELIDGIEGDTVSIYTVGGFVDLCGGPHLEDTKRIKNFKVLNSAGAYWRGDAKNTMLQRIYATAFYKKKDLDAHMHRLEEAEKRDHRKLGKALDLYEVREEAGGGLIFWYPKGGKIREVLESYLKKQLVKRGYELVVTPHIAKAHLWQTSGHYDYYKDNMYTMQVDEQEYVLKPMNCPGHILIYKRKLYSYRELPVRLAEFGTVYRRELSGALHGMLRVRGFTQDDAHVFCEPSQTTEEVGAALDFAIQVLSDCGFEDYEIELSVRDPKDPDKYAGTVEEWEHAESSLEAAVKQRGLSAKRMEGEAVFYGPKIDVKVIDAIGRPWQLSTVQFDFNLPKRFGITYVTREGDRKEVTMVHRALLGSVERFVGILTEHYAGAFPLWLAPVQVVVIPVMGEYTEYAEKVRVALEAAGIRVEVDAREEKLGYRIREAQLQKVPYMAIVGQRELDEGTVNIRAREGGDQTSHKLDDFVAEVVDESRVEG